jgi:hypothetical protein
MAEHSDACIRFLSVVGDIAAGQAEPGVAAEAAHHAHGCPDCAGELELARTIEARLTAAPDLEPPAEMWSKLEARLDELDRTPEAKPKRAPAVAGKLVRLPARG